MQIHKEAYSFVNDKKRGVLVLHMHPYTNTVKRAVCALQTHPIVRRWAINGSTSGHKGHTAAASLRPKKSQLTALWTPLWATSVSYVLCHFVPKVSPTSQHSHKFIHQSHRLQPQKCLAQGQPTSFLSRGNANPSATEHLGISDRYVFK